MLRSVLFALALTPLLAEGSAFAQSSAFQRNIDRPGLDYRSFGARRRTTFR